MERWTIQRLQEGYRSKEFSPVEVTKQYLEQIYASNPRYNAFITITEELALNQAKVLERKMIAGYDLGKMFGIPISFKDIISTKGILTTNGSYIDRDNIPGENAPVVQQMAASDGITLGKNNLHEFAFGLTSNNPHYGAVRNPWNTNKTPGGSSGGSAAAVVANTSVVSFGTDTGASIRVPASSCGIVGLKPTRGLISTKDVTGISWTLDHVGPLTANMTDLAIVMDSLTNKTYLEQSQSDVKGLKVGIPSSYFNEKVDSESYEIFEQSIKALENLGAIIVKVDLPELKENQDVGFIIALSETSFLHQQNIKNKIDQYGSDVKAIMASATGFTATDYLNSLNVIKGYTKQFEEVFKDIDVMATLTMPNTPQDIGVDEIMVNGINEDLFNYMTRNTFIFNMIGFPALSIPCGIAENGLPVGLQLAALPHREDLLMKTGFAFEKDQLEDFYQIRDSKCVIN
ncbi:amidase [Aquibacillus koreensis]|uniref:Amidase n=1 Tax=Aquibacillus koreensis TaxID=279446 RepID=A0A9X3WHJ1_9BACI|nr:amidase [Aquibacillus koreensis]MCT2537150.1 amidase [Aquibacillus koreensis]MDC3419867.1 amidase [Aquibacillus koreensis]